MFEFLNIDVGSWFDSISIWWGVGVVSLAVIGIYFSVRKEKDIAANTNYEGKVRNKATETQRQLAVERIRKTMQTQHKRTISNAEAYSFLDDLLFYYMIDALIYGSEEMLYSNMEQHIPEDIGITNEENGGWEHDTRTEKSLEEPYQPSPASLKDPVVESSSVYVDDSETVKSSSSYIDNSTLHESSSSYDSGDSDSGGSDD